MSGCVVSWVDVSCHESRDDILTGLQGDGRAVREVDAAMPGRQQAGRLGAVERSSFTIQVIGGGV